MESLTLGITTIGDLLIHQKLTSVKEEGSSMDGIILSIPDYQRPYKWRVKHISRLIDDILGAMSDKKAVYRVGTLILHKDQKGNYNIVDGQQRIISFALLLKYLREKDADAESVEIPFLLQKMPRHPDSVNNLVENYRAIQQRIDTLSALDREAFCNYVKTKCELITVITECLSTAFQFFDSQNARGRKLYPHDLLKAYHLREMDTVSESETERTVGIWETLNQSRLAVLFAEYLYRLKEWLRGNRSAELNEDNLELFKGISTRENYPYAQFFKGAFSYAAWVNASSAPFVTGAQKLSAFQLNTPIIAGAPFFEYTKHYFDLLADIRNNDKYEGWFINDNPVIKTLDLRKYRNGVGNRITRQLLDTAILLYVDRFCPAQPSQDDLAQLNRFFTYAFVWAYSLRAQKERVGWQIAENYIMGEGKCVNSFNLLKDVSEAASPHALFSTLAQKMHPLTLNVLPERAIRGWEATEDGIRLHYLGHFSDCRFLKKDESI